MQARILTGLTGAALLIYAHCGAAQTQPSVNGTEEFGMTPRQLIQAAEKVEELISQCMRKEGFSYIAVDYNTVRNGMQADKNMPGVGEEEFLRKFGFGVSTTYTGLPPQLATGYSPAKVGLGERNVEVYRKLSAADQVAYNRALFGENTGATFAVGLETENFSMTGGCTRAAIEKVFQADQIKSTYYNPKDAIVRKDPRMKAALAKYAAEMNKDGFKYNHPDEVEPDIRERLAALTNGGTILIEKMTPEQKAALKALQDYERGAALKNSQLEKKLIEPVEEKILEEMFARKSQ
jgi:hypothetical protein